MNQSMRSELDAAADDPRRVWSKRLIHLIKGRSLHECVASGRDNILHLRLLAALMVLLGHCALAGAAHSWPYEFVHMVLPRTYTHSVGLQMFFVISGFLITLSFERRPDLLRFLRARVLRLWPALVVCVLMLAFVFGPLLTHLPLRDYFARGQVISPYDFARGGVLLFDVRTVLPGVFDTNPQSHLANGPLWTIPVEATMYLWVAGAGVLRLFRFPWLTSIAIASVCSALILWSVMAGPFDYLYSKLTLQTFFGAGAIACLLRRFVPISTGLMMPIAIACFLTRHTAYSVPFIVLAVTYFVFWFAYAPHLPRIPGNLDLSYGTYLWAWPVQQTVVLVGHVREPLMVFPITVAIVLPIAALSWLYVEKPALRWKEIRLRLPQRAAQPA